MQDALFRTELSRELPLIVRGKGPFVVDAAGRSVFDATSGGVMVANIGHGVVEVADAMAKQAKQLAFAFHAHVDNPRAIELAQQIVALAPPGIAQLFFVNTGSEATETAVKFARLYHVAMGQPGRHKVVGRRYSYHGSGLASIGMSGSEASRAPYEPYLFRCAQTPPAYCYRCPWGKTPGDCATECANEIEAAILREGPNNVSCFIAEPVVGRSLGAAPAPADYFARAREICDRHGVLLIVDEVVTGFGRLGRHFGIERWGVTPDLMAIGKGIAGGYAPLAGVLVHERVADAIRRCPGRGPYGYTYGANPVSCAAGIAVNDYIARHGLISAAESLAERLLAACSTLSSHPLVGNVRGIGLLAGIEIVADRDTRESFPRERRAVETIADLAFRAGVWLLPGTGGQVDGRGDYLVLAPPLVVTESQIDDAVAVVGEVLDAARRVLKAG